MVLYKQTCKQFASGCCFGWISLYMLERIANNMHGHGCTIALNRWFIIFLTTHWQNSCSCHARIEQSVISKTELWLVCNGGVLLGISIRRLINNRKRWCVVLVNSATLRCFVSCSCFKSYIFATSILYRMQPCNHTCRKVSHLLCKHCQHRLNFHYPCPEELLRSLLLNSVIVFKC